MCSFFVNIWKTLTSKSIHDDIALQSTDRPHPKVSPLAQEIFCCPDCGRQYMIPSQDPLNIRCKCDIREP